MTPAIPKIGFISLGCPKNTVDLERIITQLQAEGYLLSSTYQEADLVIVNTCSFIEEAITESLETISNAMAENGKVIVTGCLGTSREMIIAQFPTVLAVTGPESLTDVMNAIHALMPPPHEPRLDLISPGGIKLTPRHYAYLKIAEGCNQQCTFCIIPSLRGKLVSRPLGDILNEAEQLVNAGVQELLIVSQDTAAYGLDKKYALDFWQGRPLKTKITDLAQQLGQLGIWIRLHYVYPYPQVDQLVELMAAGTILPYLDIPLQHASPTILKAMRRPADSENLLRRLAYWRKLCPELVLRSTFLVGFPGETQTDFELLLDFLEEAQLDRVGAFTYSPVAGAMANSLPGAVAEEVKIERLNQLMELQSQISADKLSQRIGQTVTVLIDEVTTEAIYARSAGEAPEIDGMVVIAPGEEFEILPGDWVEVKIIHADEHDLYAEVLNM